MATEDDVPALSRICLLTAEAGTSAEHLHDFGELPGLIFSVPYVKLPTTWAFVLVDETISDAVGYIVGSTDTRAYEKYAAEHWWPSLCEKYPLSIAVKPDDKRYINLLRNMFTASEANIAFAAAHMHINILKEYQRKGWGKKMITAAIDYLKDQNVAGAGVWLGMDERNLEARKFYERIGFQKVEGADGNQMGVKFADWRG